MKRTIESLTPPENKHVMWLDVSGKVKQLKTYINDEWVIVNDDTENNKEIVKEILEKTDKDLESYIKKEDADSKYVQQEVLDRDYVKSEYATKTYATIKELNNLSTSLDSDYVKKTYADSNYVVKNTLDGYITKSYADNTYATKSTLENYVTITDADTKYVSTGTLDNYVTIETANSTYATQTALAGKVAQETYDAKMTAIDSKLKTLENKTIDVDAELKDSPNPVQNRAVNAAVLNLNTEIGKKANSTDLNSAVGRITALENNGATGVTVTESGEGNGIASIKNVGKNIIATKATFVTSLTGYVTTDTLNTELAKKSDVGHTHTQYAETSALDNYALKSALDNYVTTSSLNQKNFATQTWVNNQGFAIGTIPTKVSDLTNDSGYLTTHQSLDGYVNEVQPDGTSGNGIANITKEGKVLKVTKATFLTEHQSLDGYVNNVNVTEVTNGNGIASIAKNGKDINVTQGAFLTAINGIIAEIGESVAGKGVVDISIRGNKLVKRRGTFVTPETLGTSIDDYASNKGYLTENNLNEKLKETVTIKLVSDKSASDANLNGATITVKSGDTTVSTQTWHGTPINIKVPCDKEVTIEAATVNMYMKPKMLKYVPSPLYNREVTFTYKALELGIFIIDKNDKTYKTAEEFTDSGTDIKDVIGTLLVTDNAAIVVANYNSGNVPWGPKVLVDGCTVANDTTTAVQDFAGAANTAAIMKVAGAASVRTAASICYNYIFGNGRRGHLMSAGEGAVIQTLYSDIRRLMNQIGINDSSVISSNNYYWTSTQISASKVYRYIFYNFYPQDDNKNNMNYAIPIYSLYD